MDLLASSVVEGVASRPGLLTKDHSLWLVSHFIALNRCDRSSSNQSAYVRALYLQLSALSGDISLRLPSIRTGDSSKSQQGHGNSDGSFPRYIVEQLESLVDRDNISILLERFTSSHNASPKSGFEDASLLAAYTLTLIRCFPASGDDIRMRLYLADVSTQSGRVPAVQFFWAAMKQTSLFRTIVSSENAALDVLRQRQSKQSFTATDEAGRDRQWRTVLLFLELYTFVLRLTDDDDFFSGMNISDLSTRQESRLRSSGLSLADLTSLSLFLKHLNFPMYYNAAELLHSDDKAAPTLQTQLDVPHSAPSRARQSSSSTQTASQREEPYNIIPGIEFDALRNLASTAMRMLYERDSRRSFLPNGHWLMTSKFDMDGFLKAVVLEEQRQQELQDANDDDEDESDNDLMENAARASYTFAAQRQSRHFQIERLKERQRKSHRERLLAAMGPKLEILRNMPFVIPFETRVQIFRQFVHLDKERRRGGNIDPDRWRMWVISQNGGDFGPQSAGRDIISRHHAQIQRGQLFDDALEQFYELGEGLKEPIQITFVDKFGTVEAGIDGGGVTKEFLTSVIMEAFTRDKTLFVANRNNSLYPNPCALDQRQEMLRQAGMKDNSEEWRESVADLLREFEFLGRIVGKCMYEGILIDIVFAGFFLLQWASHGDSSYRANINDLREMDEELYQGMLTLKNYSGDVSEMGLDFSINDQVSLPSEPVKTMTRDLIAHGSEVPVTVENRPLYISYVARHRLVGQAFLQTRAFLRGLGSIIEPSWVSMFNQSELQRLVGGDSSEIDVEDLRANTVYSGVYTVGDDGEEHPTVRLFWEVMHGLRDGRRRDVLKYVTSTPRAPLLGFGQLSPPFSIRDGGSDQERLPSASTCVNLLKLPQYKDMATLRRKLLYAVTSNAGFDLS